MSKSSFIGKYWEFSFFKILLLLIIIGIGIFFNELRKEYITLIFGLFSCLIFFKIFPRLILFLLLIFFLLFSNSIYSATSPENKNHISTISNHISSSNIVNLRSGVHHDF